jgi:hypothetical protein
MKHLWGGTVQVLAQRCKHDTVEGVRDITVFISLVKTWTHIDPSCDFQILHHANGIVSGFLTDCLHVFGIGYLKVCSVVSMTMFPSTL